MMKLQPSGFVRGHHILPWIEAAAIGREESDKLGNPSGDGRLRPLNSELRLRLRNEYASSRVFRGGKLMSSSRGSFKQPMCPEGSG